MKASTSGKALQSLHAKDVKTLRSAVAWLVGTAGYSCCCDKNACIHAASGLWLWAHVHIVAGVGLVAMCRFCLVVEDLLLACYARLQVHLHVMASFAIPASRFRASECLQ